jgi:hypothetical protein
MKVSTENDNNFGYEKIWIHKKMSFKNGYLFQEINARFDNIESKVQKIENLSRHCKRTKLS